MESKYGIYGKVVSAVHGVGYITEIDPEQSSPIRVRFSNGRIRSYLENGKYQVDDLYPDIYFDGDIHPLFNVPIRIPKQKVKKQFELFLHKERVQNSFVLEWDNGRFWVSDLMYDKPCISAKIIFEVEE